MHEVLHAPGVGVVVVVWGELSPDGPAASPFASAGFGDDAFAGGAEGGELGGGNEAERGGGGDEDEAVGVVGGFDGGVGEGWGGHRRDVEGWLDSRAWRMRVRMEEMGLTSCTCAAISRSSSRPFLAVVIWPAYSGDKRVT